VRQFGYLPELYEDARSEKYKILSLSGMVPLRTVAFFGTRRIITTFTSATLNDVYLFHQVMLISKVVSEHIDAFVRSWHESKNSFTLNVRLLSGDETWVHYFIPGGGGGWTVV
jgi:hypothetical protein